MRTGVLFAVTIALPIVAASSFAGAPTAGVTGGTPSSDAAVVALVRADQLVCSGTVIAPHVVLTAAHCLNDSHVPEVVLDSAIAGAVARRSVVAAFIHPAFDAETLANDVAMIVVDPALPATPIPFATSLGGAGIGSTIRVVGYGWTVAGDTMPAERRTGTSRIDAIDAAMIQSSAAPNQVCEGDSGGPALHDDGTGERIIGIASSGDTGCNQVARHTRVDAHAELIAGVIAATAEHAAGAGARCYYEDQCETGSCLPALDEPRWSFCTPACDHGACPAGLVCVTTDGDARCRHREPSPGAEGAACASNTDCADDLCLAPAGSTKTVCTRRCFSDLPGFDCPAQATCRAATDGGEACFVPEEDTGCVVARGNGSALVLVALGLLVRSRLARTR